MNSDSRELVRGNNCLAIAAHLRDRAPKHEHQAEAKNEFADDICFHFYLFFFLVEVGLLNCINYNPVPRRTGNHLDEAL
jgi:hypothetical protein